MNEPDTELTDAASLGVAISLVAAVALATALVLLFAMPARANASVPGCTGAQVVTAA